ncbi:hypothetical protein MAM1_0039c02825 [Mucor ambiguus]|uniref:Secreted protein n=1 Tax=Mucor ambiguus TaxID=91626 RepID=A0A0C9MJP1_9FUNG|nr:hypothetical protein MAM1_0039c02825 [Mucor ambiguus]
MLLNSVFVLSLATLFQAANIHAQNVETVDSNSTVSQQQPIDKPGSYIAHGLLFHYVETDSMQTAGLPNVEWDILKIDPSARENLCQRQTAYCANNCGGPNQAPKNFCNATTMAWGCGCSHKVADFAPFLWPVVQAECSGKAQECQMICNKDTVNPSTCAATCNTYYQCDTDKAPPSYLQTESPNDTPSYNGPPKEISKTDNSNNRNGNSSDSHASRASKFTSNSNAYLVAAIAASASSALLAMTNL